MQTTARALKFDTILPRGLNPITSLTTSRYGNSGCAQFCSRVIPQGPAFIGRNLLALGTPPNEPAEIRMSSITKWQRFVHPEGKPYFVLTGEFDFVVVTESNVEDLQIEGRVLGFLKVTNKELQSRDIKVPPRSELFLELGEDDTSCNYYFVDHIGKGLFWLEGLGTEFLDIPAAVSPSHLGMALERLYWVHVEFFPMHHDSHQQAFSQIVDDLYNTISHGQADRLTSRTSTFPYTADSCKYFLKLLSRKKGQRVDGYTLCYAGRLAGAILNQRFITLYGQQSAQLDRLQEMCPSGVVEHKWLSTVTNLLMWGIPAHYIGLLTDLYMNEQVYVDQWAHFMSISLADWKNSLSWSLPVFIASVLLTKVRGGTVSASIPSVLSCAISVATASCLHLRYRPLAESSASVGARYLCAAKSNTLGFFPLSVAFSLPRAGYLWGIGFLIAQFLFIISHVVNRLVALVAASVIAGTLIFMLWVIHPADTSIVSFGSLASFCNPYLYAPDAHQGESIV